MGMAVLTGSRDTSRSASALPPSDAEVALYESIPNPLLLCREDGVISYVNRLGAALLERPQDMLIGRPFSELFATSVEQLCVMADGATLQGEHRCLAGPPSHQKAVAFRASKSASGEGFMVSFRDHRQQDKLTEERDRLLRVALLGEMLPAVLHELRNPLAAVSCAVENLLEEVIDDDALRPHERLLGAILRELRRMSLTFDGLGSIRRGLRGTQPEPIDTAIDDTCRILLGAAQRNQIKLEWKVDSLPMLPLEPGVLRAVVFNLLNNAIQACQPGDMVNVHAAVDDTWLVITVRDTGRGMTPEVLKQAMDPFFTTRANGTGLGLAIYREAVEEAGGQLVIDSSLGNGSTATMRVPLTQQPINPQGAHLCQPPSCSRPTAIATFCLRTSGTALLFKRINI